MKRYTAIFYVIPFLFGCAVSPSVSPKATALKNGMTMEQVRSQCGAPTKTSSNSDGTVWEYTNAQPANPLSAFAPAKLLLINFNHEGRVVYFANRGY